MEKRNLEPASEIVEIVEIGSETRDPPSTPHVQTCEEILEEMRIKCGLYGKTTYPQHIDETGSQLVAIPRNAAIKPNREDLNR